MSGNQGLSRQFISTILVRGSVELRKRLFVADVSRSGFHVSQSSPSSSRSVGMSLTRSEEHTSELQSLMRISYAVFCLKKKTETRSTHRPPKYNLYQIKYIKRKSDL